jgi:hypothetical protein
MHWSGLAAILAGGLRSMTAFIPYASTVPLELLYVVIDIGILFGIIGLYSFQHQETGLWGFWGFVIAMIGISSIVGPETEFAGFNLYLVGTVIFSAGLILLAIGSWFAHKLPRWIPVCWVLSIAVGSLGYLDQHLSPLLILSGVLFGIAFSGAGCKIWSATT